MEEFEEFWKIYPRKEKKGDARKAWGQTASIRPAKEVLLQSVEDHKRCPQWLKDEGQYIPLPATFLRAEQWEDVLKIELGPNKNGKLWHETASGITAKGQELGITQDQYGGDWLAFRAAVYRAAGVEIKRAA